MCISLWFCLVCKPKLLLRPQTPNPLITRVPLLLPTAIRSSWRIRRKSRRKRGRLDGTTSSGQPDTEKSSVREDQRSDERPHQANLPHAVPERPRSQRGSAREPPVIIGDPTVSLFLGDWAGGLKARAPPDHLSLLTFPSCYRYVGRGNTRSREPEKDLLSYVVPTNRGQSGAPLLFPLEFNTHNTGHLSKVQSTLYSALNPRP